MTEKRINPDGVINGGLEVVSKPADLRIAAPIPKLNFSHEQGMVALADSLNKFASGTLALDRTSRMLAQEKAKELYLQQSELDKAKWVDLTDKMPLASRFNPYTKNYYNDLLAEQIAQSNIAQMQLEYTAGQMVSKDIKDVQSLFEKHKKRMSEQLNEKELRPSNQIKAIESFETTRNKMLGEYVPKNADYRYKEGLGKFRERATSELKDLDVDYNNKKPSENIALISQKLALLTDEAHKNGMLKEDITKELKHSVYDYVQDTIDSPVSNFDEAQFLSSLKEVKVGDYSLNELSPNFISEVKGYINNAYDMSLHKGERAVRLEETKTRHALVIGSAELMSFTGGLSGEVTKPENVKKILAKIDEISARDPYFMRNKTELIKLVLEGANAYDQYNSFTSRYLLANYYKMIADDPSKLDLEQVYIDYTEGRLGKGDYISLTQVFGNIKSKGLATEGSLLVHNYGENFKAIKALDINEKLKQEMFDSLNNDFVDAFRQLNDPRQQNPEAFNNYQKKYKDMIGIAEKKSKEYDDLEKTQNMLDTINENLSKTEPSKGLVLFGWDIKNPLNSPQYTTAVRKGMPLRDQGMFKEAVRTMSDISNLKANDDISHLANRKVSLTSSYGLRSYTQNGKQVTKFHDGDDVAPQSDSLGRNTLVANIVGEGRVQLGQQNGGAGNYVKVTMASNPKCAYYVMHLDSYIAGLTSGMTIKNNTPLGFMGNTGNVRGSNGSDGTHTHVKFEYAGKAVTETFWKQQMRL